MWRPKAFNYTMLGIVFKDLLHNYMGVKFLDFTISIKAK